MIGLVSREARLFNRIAPVYGMFFKFQVNYFRNIFDLMGDELNLNDYTTIIDVGCGTGALSYVLQERGHRVTGIDISEKMLAVARRKLAHTDVQLIQANLLKTVPFPSQSFDLVIASYVVHGSKQPQRLQMYQEMARLAKHKILIHDYNQERGFLTDVAERFEGGDYFHFIAHAQAEMEQVFSQLKVANVGKRAAWYIAAP